MAKKESALQAEIRDYLRSRGWMVEVFTCGAFQKGIPDIWAFHPKHGYRWIDIKRPKGSKLTKAQCQKWPVWEEIGVGVWIMTECDDSVLFGEPNFRDWWKPSYDKYLVKSGAEILQDFLDSDE